MNISKAICTLLFLFLAESCSSQAQYPNKPIRIVIPTPPGSAASTVARILADSVSKSIGQSVIIDSKPGADGAIAGIEVVKALPDGYTLLMGSGGPIAAIGALRKNPPYDPIKELTPVSDIGRFTIFLYVTPSLPVRTFFELVSYAKAHPNLLAYATGNASGLVTTAQMNFLSGGLEMIHIPYRGEGPAVIDLLTGRVQLMWATPTVGLSYVKSGQLRVLATQLTERSVLLPDVPTLKEVGLSNFSITSFAAIYGPAKLPSEIINRLNEEFKIALMRPDVIANMEKQAFVITHGSPSDLAKLTEVQVREFGRMARQAGIVPD